MPCYCKCWSITLYLTNSLTSLHHCLKNDSKKHLTQSQSKQQDKTEMSTQYEYVRTISMIRSSEPDANISPSWLKLKVLTGQLQPDKRKRSLELNWSLMYKKSNIIIKKWNDIWFHTNLTYLYVPETWAQLICIIKKIINLSTLLNSLAM